MTRTTPPFAPPAAGLADDTPLYIARVRDATAALLRYAYTGTKPHSRANGASTRKESQPHE